MNANVNRTPDVVDIHIAGVSKQRFRIDGDDSKIIELNTSDVGIADRLADAYPKLMELQEKANKLKIDTGDGDGLDAVKLKESTSKLMSIDKEMRVQIDYIFDFPVNEVCASTGTMYDPIEGAFRYEIIVEALINLYEKNYANQMKKAKARAKANTQKFTK